MKILTLLLTLLAASTLAACQSAPIQKAATPDNSKQIGDSGIHVSGALEAGGSVSNR